MIAPHPQPQSPSRFQLQPWGHAAALAAILMVAAALRLWDLGRLSLWYDEVITMRLARQPDPAALIRLLGQIDATRAPLHPLLLQGWLHLFGPSEAAGRALSALCGIVTVALVYQIGRDAFDTPTSLWAAWLAALSPPLVSYAREVRMYAWLVLVTCLGWWLLLSLRRSTPPGKQALFAMSLIALVYSHPLGLLMVGALILGALALRPLLRVDGRAWLVIYGALVLAVTPWVGRYFDHPPESTSGRLPLRFLLGLPIGFIGGDFRTLAVSLALIVWGMFSI
ncbi:MAG: glycosyltransferase family 39 protein, partial [Isosphaeraceae bacterium]|nr:glycosyltransferase family 39 protein [Isosphaeraceae bacterium]